MNKGFTLVELLAIIVILSFLMLVASSTIGSIIYDSKEKLSDAEVGVIEEVVKVWAAENNDLMPIENECAYFTLGDFKKYGLLENNIIDPKTNKKISNNLKIKITSKKNKMGKKVFNYDIDPNDVEGCTMLLKTICTSVTSKTKTSGNIPSGNFDNGDEYICEVKPGVKYHFFVLSKEKNKINLIMDRNINSDGSPVEKAIAKEEAENGVYNLVPWISQEDYDKFEGNETGPITAMDFISEATKNWTNTNKMVIDSFNDDTGAIYEMKAYNTYARMPYYSEVETHNGTNGYLYDYLELENNIQTNSISEIYGYWTLSFRSSIDSRYYVINNGSVTHLNLGVEDSIGVRPVIMIHKSNFK